MQKIERIPLDSETAKKLDNLTKQVASADDPKKEAADLWAALARATRSRIQRALAEMSNGLERCMYCEDSEGTDIEHFRPKASYPNDAFSWPNYLLACTRCNSNYKRTRFPLDPSGNPLLIDPTVDEPSTHLAFSPTTGRFDGLTPSGTETISICGLNREICSKGRLNAWTTISYLIPAYAREKDDGRTDKAARILETLREFPFQSVQSYMARIFIQSSNPSLMLSDDLIGAFSRFPELLEQL